MSETKPNKAEAVRAYIADHPQATRNEVASALEGQGVKVTVAYVSQIKHQAKSTRAKGKATALPGSKGTKWQAWTFPKNPLEEAIRIPMQIEEKNAGNPMPASLLAKAVGYHQPNDWRFLELLRSANQYGLVSVTGARATVRMEKLGQDIVIPASPQDRQKALLAAFTNFPDFKAVAAFYGDKKIPDDEYFLNTLTRQFNIPRDRAQAFADVFGTNLKYLRAFDVTQPERSKEGIPAVEGERTAAERRVLKQPQVRAFLDTCFVMMPFGNWFDRYYQDIYVPAIREAGFEPRERISGFLAASAEVETGFTSRVCPFRLMRTFG